MRPRYMKRKFKFRVWSNICGHFCSLERDGFNTVTLPDGGLRLEPQNGSDSWVAVDKFNNYDVQYSTGVQDKRGEDIFLGDILSLYLPKMKMYENGEVIWSKEYLTYLVKFYVKGDYYSDYLCDLQNKAMEFEIIGNIYENPNLLPFKKI